MFKFTKTDILTMEKAFQLIDDNIFTENLEVFVELSLIEKRALAARIILDCTYEKCSNLANKIGTLKKDERAQKFLCILTEALLVNELLDVLRAGSPSDFFENKHYNPQLFFDFSSLVAARLKENERHIASRLASKLYEQQHRMIEANLLELAYKDTTPTPFAFIYTLFCNNTRLSEESIQPLQDPAIGNQNTNNGEFNPFRFHSASSSSNYNDREDGPSEHISLAMT